MEFVSSFKLKKNKVLIPLLKGLSFISKIFPGRIDFSAQSSSVILASKKEALRWGNDAIQVEHILFSLLKSGNGNIIKVLEKLNCELNALQQQIEGKINRFPKKEKNSNLPFSTHAKNAIKLASSIARDFK